ncbi:hypothetical protein DSM104299_03504 [Baekduia alba]|uniref:pilus assembly PilX family protein n=1 Tax=Baekduia alba TaxID=2997333 RepID=UPI002340EF59|nr:hypothetical protein [Baekduia alba]WCB94765.1 hypothetical protein DSM104299_03504 [Baekduia alba]
MNRCRRFVSDQEGFTLVAVTITMMVLSLFAVSAWAAANNALPGTTKDSDSKRAYEAAEAGVQWYQFQVQRDTNYWTKCADATNGIFLKGGRPATTATTGWRNVPGSDEAFAVELVGDTTDNATCQADPGSHLLTDGVLTVRSTGRFNGKLRQIVAKFRRAGFIDYIYYTKRETAPPPSYGNATNVQWAQDNCDQTRLTRPSGCTDITFRDTDVIAGPFHTEDSSVLVCGNPQFGSSAADKVEIVKAPNASSWYKQGCSGSVTPTGTLVAPAKSLELPKNNLQLASQATYKFKGNTCLKFSGATLTVYPNQTTWGVGGTVNCTGATTTYTLGANTVIWVANNGTCPDAYDYLQNYSNSSNCGDVAVSGNYGTNVTIGSEDDVIVTDDLKWANTSAMMGLVANQFVRVYHPVTPSNRSSNQGGCSNNGGSQVNEIDAAILATQGSFITDNWDCGSGLGNLTVKGAITQYWRGAVGTSGGNGYTKDYNYDKRLRYREPPNFLDPTTALWGVLRQSEQSPVQTG